MFRHHTAFGQQFAVSGINRAARGGDLGIGKPLFRRSLNTVLLSIPDLQGIQLINQNRRTPLIKPITSSKTMIRPFSVAA